MNRKMVRAVSIITIGVVLAIASAYGVINSLTIPNTGHISMINVYWDAACTQQISTIDWGNLVPDSFAVKNIYVKNWGATSVTISLTVTGWSPVNADDYIHLSWNRDGDVLTGGMALEAVLTMTVYPNVTQSAIGAFSTNTIITAN